MEKKAAKLMAVPRRCRVCGLRMPNDRWLAHMWKYHRAEMMRMKEGKTDGLVDEACSAAADQRPENLRRLFPRPGNVPSIAEKPASECESRPQQSQYLPPPSSAKKPRFPWHLDIQLLQVEVVGGRVEIHLLSLHFWRIRIALPALRSH